jgi:hypothetical protein
MEHHQHEQPEDKQPLKSSEDKDSVKKKPKKRRKLRRPAFNATRYLPDKNKPVIPTQAEFWAWPRVKPKPEQQPSKPSEEVDTVLDKPTKLQPTEIIYQEEELSDELPLTENSQFVTIPLSSYSESEILLHSYSEETSDADSDLTVAEVKSLPLTESQAVKSEAQSTVDELSSVNLQPVAIEDKAESAASVQISETVDRFSEQSAALPVTPIPTTIETDTKPLNYTNTLVNEGLLANPLENTPAAYDPNLISAADYQTKPDRGTSVRPSNTKTETSLQSKLARWWQQLPKPKLLNYYSKKDRAPITPPPTPTATVAEQQASYERNYAPNTFRRTVGRHLSVSEFVTQLKESPNQRESSSPSKVIDQVTTSKPIEAISQFIPSFQPQLAEASGAVVGSMNYIIKSTPYYPEHYQRSTSHGPAKHNELWQASFKSEGRQNPAELKVAEDFVIPSPAEGNRPITNQANTAPSHESTYMSDKSWDEIVAIEAERLRIASKRRPENIPAPAEPEPSQPPDIPPELPPDRQIQNSVWHRIEVDKKTGRAVGTPTLAYGEAFQQEQHQEMPPPPADSAGTASGQLAAGPPKQIDQLQPATLTAKAGSETAPDSSSSNQIESTIRVRQSSNFNSTDLWLWIILIIVILAVVIAISV